MIRYIPRHTGSRVPVRAIAVACLLAAQAAVVTSAPFASAAQAAQSALPTGGTLFGISCTSSSNCWAAGYNSSGMEMLHWDGQTWSSVPSPVVGRTTAITSSANHLAGLTCSGERSCWAVGGAYASASVAAPRNLALHWNGRKWTDFPAPRPARYRVMTPQQGTVTAREIGNASLTGVACTSGASCWAVGQVGVTAGPLSGAHLNQILHWNGTRWSVVAVPDPGNIGRRYSAGLVSVACTGAHTCWAVGTYSTASGVQSQRDELLGWNGTHWSLVRTPHKGTEGGLESVACPSAGECLAVGHWWDGTGSTLQALIWNGAAWATMHLLDGQQNWIAGASLACSSSTDCWVMGDKPSYGF